MKQKDFNPQDWLNNTEPDNNIQTQENPTYTDSKPKVRSDIEEIIGRIESGNIDITNNYNDWRDIGFALADKFGESGREYFHRISKFHSDYSSGDCDTQFDKCLNSHNSGITIKTFFHFVKKAGIKIVTENSEIKEEEKLPLIPESVYKNLPEYFKKTCHPAQTNEEKDILLLGSIAAISSSIPNVYGFYDRRKVYANVYLFVTAKASAGKGLLNHCRELVTPVHKSLRDESKLSKEQYERDLNMYNSTKKDNPDAEKPPKPSEKMLFIPANSSATGVFQLLDDNEGKGLIFETEGDTLANTFKSDYGNYSDGFRKAFHHENISYYRRTDREHVEIDKPSLSAVLSGTPNQILNLFPDAENGLFSRFMFYYLNIKNEWKNVFANDFDKGLDEYFETLGVQFFELYKELQSGLEIKFSFTFDQQNQFNKVFEQLQDNYLKLLGDEYTATVRRLGLIAFRTAMIFSVLRILETGEKLRIMICEERDFKSAMAIIQVLIVHAKKVFSELPVQIAPVKRANRKQKFFAMLPEKFSRQDYVNIASGLNIPDKTAQGYITEFVKKGFLHRDKKDEYIKPNNEEIKEIK